MIKDSGQRTEFETGAVRDMHEGKGRFDLLPWPAIWEVAKHCENGALKYGEHNVDKGIPVHSLIDSAIRHTMKFWLGMDDEPHLTAACWNLLWALYMMLEKPEMDDRQLAEGRKCKNCGFFPESNGLARICEYWDRLTNQEASCSNWRCKDIETGGERQRQLNNT